MSFDSAQEFGQIFYRNLQECKWEPHPLYSVFTQYDQKYYLDRQATFLDKYRCFYAVSKTISPKTIIELGTSAGASADAYLSATPRAKYIGFDSFAENRDRDDRPPWKPDEIARKLFTARGFTDYELIKIDLRSLEKLPCRADFVVVDAGHDFDNEYSDLRLALTAEPDFIFVDDSDAEAKPAIEKFLREDLRGRVTYTFPIDYAGGGLVIKLENWIHASNKLMIEVSQPEVSVEELRGKIREAVARREAEGKTSFIDASAQLFKVLSSDTAFWDSLSAPDSLSEQTNAGQEEITRLRLQHEFSVRDDDRYHINDLLLYHDREFIWNTYRALLKREPDEEGDRSYLELLRSGRRNKIDIIDSLHRSPEGKRAKVSIEGLAVPAMIRRLYRLPIIGYFAELSVALARLPVLVRSQRQLECHLVAQQDRIASHFTQTNQQLLNMINQIGNRLAEAGNRLAEADRANAASFQDALTGFAEQQKRIAELQHQQVTALFREQQKLIDNHRLVTGDAGPQQLKSKTSNRSQQAPGQTELDRLQASFEDRFRGDKEELKKDLKFYLSLLKESNVTSEILDLGCGRGEWLELLKEERLSATGVESNRTLADAGRSRGLEIIQQDAIEYLRGQPNNSLQAVTGFHLIEHLEFQELIQLLAEIRRTLKPGGLVIVETPNPKNLVVGACNFYADPTHRKPLFPETLQFLLDSLGFERIRLEYRHPVEGSPFDNTEPGSRELHIWLFGPRDFAAIGWKA